MRTGGIIDRKGLTVAREELEMRYFGLTRLAQASGRSCARVAPTASIRAAAFVNLLSVYALVNWPAYGAFSATEAACLSAAQSLRAELRQGGVKVVNAFFGPLETEWYQAVPPPKVAPSALARAVVRALQQGWRTCSSATSPRTSARGWPSIPRRSSASSAHEQEYR